MDECGVRLEQMKDSIGYAEHNLDLALNILSDSINVNGNTFMQDDFSYIFSELNSICNDIDEQIECFNKNNIL